MLFLEVVVYQVLFLSGYFDCGFGKQVLKFGVCGFRVFLGW